MATNPEKLRANLAKAREALAEKRRMAENMGVPLTTIRAGLPRDGREAARRYIEREALALEARAKELRLLLRSL